MEQKPLPPPQEKSVSGQQGPQSMAEIEQFVAQTIQEEGINVNQLITLGQMADKAIKDPALFQMFKQQAIANDIADPEDFTDKNKWQILATISAMGKVAQNLMSSGKVKG